MPAACRLAISCVENCVPNALADSPALKTIVVTLAALAWAMMPGIVPSLERASCQIHIAVPWNNGAGGGAWRTLAAGAEAAAAPPRMARQTRLETSRRTI